MGHRKGSRHSGRRRRRWFICVVAAALPVVVGLPAVPAQAAAAPTVVGLWHMDESPGATTMTDSSGYGHDGAIGSAVRLGTPSDDGTTGYTFAQPGGLIRVPHDASLNPGSSPMTVTARLRVAADLPAGDYNVLQKGTATASGGAYKLEIDATRSGSTRFGFPDCAFNGAAGKNRVYGPSSIADGTWHMVACVLTASQAYVTVDGRPGPAEARQVSTIGNTVDLTIGAKPDGSHGYVGDADEVSISIG
jgi:hypothetical protein